MTGLRRYEQMFARLRARGEGAFGAFVMLGHPDLKMSAAILDALVRGGADMLEVGIPFSDPVADGPTIQAAADRALANGVTPADCFKLLAEFRTHHREVPVGVLTYANLVIARGREEFYGRCRDAGVDSVLVADVPAFEAGPFAQSARRANIVPVMIAAPNTPSERLEQIARLGSGYTYCVARAGVTGVREELALDHERLFEELRRLGAAPPILGFGISTPEHVRTALAAGAAGVISGSAIVRLIEEDDDPAAAVERFAGELKAATKADFG